MIRIANAQLWVHDQDEALAFYTGKLGWQVGVDVTVPELGNFRQASYEELKGRGVEFTEAPEQRPYGIDCGFRDPSGNALRLTQVVGDLAAI